MKTLHRICFGDSRDLSDLKENTVHLVVTSPPYPMIEMWDALFAALNPDIERSLARNQGDAAFEQMHAELDKVWAELWRVMVPGGIACINIGDATRTLDGRFELFANHARILSAMKALGFSALPAILWRKPTNAPNKFMGSGMLPPGAYVTLEHEYILILRKGNKRLFQKPAAKQLRQESAFFWEERNQWFSDVWFGLIGTQQKLMSADLRKRSGAFPLELAYRLIAMFSVKSDLVLDPFLGTGTTSCAAAASGRSSVGWERDRGFDEIIRARLAAAPEWANQRIAERIAAHEAFVAERIAQGKPPKHRNQPYGFPVVTKQEANLFLNPVSACDPTGDGSFEAAYDRPSDPQPALPAEEAPPPEDSARGTRKRRRKRDQLGLFDPPAGSDDAQS